MKKVSKQQTPKVLKDFCESTSLHGYSNFQTADSFLAKTIWAVIILLATGIGLNFLVINTKASVLKNIFLQEDEFSG